MKSSIPKNKLIQSLNNVLVIGSGGRENSLAWAIKKCKGVKNVFLTPGNGGSTIDIDCLQLDISEQDIDSLRKACESKNIDLVVVGPEAPLAQGIADKLRAAGFTVFGPGADGAQLEASKGWAKALMVEAGIPTAKYWEASSEEEALSILSKASSPLVVKADGLASGKGVTVADTKEATEVAIREAFNGKFGPSGKKLLLEERLKGPEVSVFALCDGKSFILLPPAQDHKRLKDGDLGPNTGGMGAYAPAPLLTKQDLEEIGETIIKPTLKALKNRNIDYRGVIYAGLMLTKLGPKVIEFNCRFGDPECQALMPLMGEEFAHILQACSLGELDKSLNLSISDDCSACVVATAKGYPEKPISGDIVDIQIKSDKYIQVFHSGTKINNNGEITTSGGRVISVVSQGNNFDDAFKNLYTGLEKIKFQGMFYRKDIGHQIRN